MHGIDQGLKVCCDCKEFAFAMFHGGHNGPSRESRPGRPPKNSRTPQNNAAGNKIAALPVLTLIHGNCEEFVCDIHADGVQLANGCIKFLPLAAPAVPMSAVVTPATAAKAEGKIARETITIGWIAIDERVVISGVVAIETVEITRAVVAVTVVAVTVKDCIETTAMASEIAVMAAETTPMVTKAAPMTTEAATMASKTTSMTSASSVSLGGNWYCQQSDSDSRHRKYSGYIHNRDHVNFAGRIARRVSVHRGFVYTFQDTRSLMFIPAGAQLMPKLSVEESIPKRFT